MKGRFWTKDTARSAWTGTLVRGRIELRHALRLAERSMHLTRPGETVSALGEAVWALEQNIAVIDRELRRRGILPKHFYDHAST